MRPKKEEHPEYYEHYISLVKQEDILNALTETTRTTLEFIRNIPIELANYAYADAKWTIKEVLIHCVDTERIFAARALAFARGDAQRPHSYDENLYAANCHAGLRSLKDIEEEFEAVRNANTHLFKSFSIEALMHKGETPAGYSTVNSIGFCICGHTQHHLNIIKERYLKK